MSDDDVIRGERAIAEYMEMTRQNMQYLGRRKMDPMPVRIALNFAWALRSRLDLWKQREPFHGKKPNESLPILWTREIIGKAINLAPRSMARYIGENAPFVPLPMWKHKGLDWSYSDAVADWLDSQSMSLSVRAALKKAKIGPASPDDVDTSDAVLIES